ncbi:MAG: class I SAM-dependent methyltransferase [Parcubacteria group bacterium]|nr:class I SAM-dependent methyltransferase [Parcubacteria group bacterium]
MVKILAIKFLKRIQSVIEAELGRLLPHPERMKYYWDHKSSPEKRAAPSIPSRPSAATVEIYRDFLKCGEVKNALLLGATPILRDLLTERGLKNYVVADFSLAMIKNNMALCKKADPENEVWVKADWLSLPLQEDHFDIILGDMLLSQLLPADQPDFLKTISNLLRRNGRFITRVHVIDPEMLKAEPREIIRETLRLKTNSAYDRLLTYRLRDRLRDPATQLNDLSKLLHALSDYHPRNQEEELIIRRAKGDLKKRRRLNLPWITQSAEELESLFKIYFEIGDKKYADDHEDRFAYPVYYLRKR